MLDPNDSASSTASAGSVQQNQTGQQRYALANSSYFVQPIFEIGWMLPNVLKRHCLHRRRSSVRESRGGGRKPLSARDTTSGHTLPPCDDCHPAAPKDHYRAASGVTPVVTFKIRRLVAFRCSGTDRDVPERWNADKRQRRTRSLHVAVLVRHPPLPNAIVAGLSAFWRSR